MTKTAIIFGYGPGISHEVAEKFGNEGFNIAIVSRTQNKLDKACEYFATKNINAKGYSCDLAKPESIPRLVTKIRSEIGPINLIHWNSPSSASCNLTNATNEMWQNGFNVSCVSLSAAVQNCLADLEASKGSILVTSGGFGFDTLEMTEMALNWNAPNWAVFQAAKRKYVSLLSQFLKPKGVYVCEVDVCAVVKTRDPQSKGTLESSKVSNLFYEMYKSRKETFKAIQ
jgi:short-subunit dehydrogenase